MSTQRPFFGSCPRVPAVGASVTPLISQTYDGQHTCFRAGALDDEPGRRTTAATHHHRAGYRQKRHSSPLSGGPLPKRRSLEERMVGDLQNLSLTMARPRTSENVAARWRELESRLSDDDSDSEAPSAAGDAGPRLLVAEELRQAMAGVTPDLIPPRPDNSMALVLWRPPPVQLPPAAPEEPAAPEAVPSSTPAYDFSRFAAEEQAVMAPEQRYHFTGLSGLPSAAPLFPGFGLELTPSDGEPMDM